MASQTTDNKQFEVKATRPTTYLDDTGKAVNGFVVTVLLNGYDELHEVRTPTLDPKTVKRLIDQLVAQRNGLADL